MATGGQAEFEAGLNDITHYIIGSITLYDDMIHCRDLPITDIRRRRASPSYSQGA